MAVGGGQGTTLGQIHCPTCRATLPANTGVCPICSTNLWTAAPLAATHTQVAAVSIPPTPGPAQPPAPAGGFQPVEEEPVFWAEPEGPTPPASPPPTAGPPLTGFPSQRAPPPPGAPAASVEELLRQAGAPELTQDSLRRMREPAPEKAPPKRRGRRKAKEDLPPEEMRDRIMRQSVYLIVAISVVGWVSSRLRRGSLGTGVFKVIDVAGLVAMGISLYLLFMSMRVASKTRERMSPAEAGRLSYVRMGGLVLWLVPFVGAFLAVPLGIVYQTSSMSPVYYFLVGGGALLILLGIAGMKERGSYFSVFMFGVYSVVLGTVPIALPVMGEVMASVFWWSSTFIMIGAGFVFMALVLRQMRSGQYTQLDEVIASADRAFEARRYDEAMRLFSQGITLTHTLYSDAVFAAQNPRGGKGSTVPEEYFRPWIGKAKCLAISGKFRKALAIYDLMLEIDPDLPEVWYDRGRMMLVEKRYAEAYISFDRAVKLDPVFEEARRSLAETLDLIRKTHA